MNKHAIWISFVALLVAFGMVLGGVSLAAAGAGAEARILAQEDGDDPDDDLDDPSEGYYCLQSEDPHPFGARLAGRYEDLDYPTLQGWFCDGFGWGQIMLALRTRDITGQDIELLLERRRGGEGWGEIWKEQGLIGRPEDAGPPNDEDGDGRPDHAGPPPWAKKGGLKKVPPGWAKKGYPDNPGPPWGPPDDEP